MPTDSHTAVTVVAPSTRDEQARAAGVPCLVVLYGKELGKQHFLDRPELVLGRSASAGVRLDDDSVSRHHARIVSRDGRARVVDLGSTNGTFVNDRRVDETDLEDGDRLQVGETIFKYLSGSNVESKYHDEIYRLTTTDGLTGAYNKRFFVEALAREVDRARRYERPLSLAMVDIDHFKRVNDRWGHLAGDYVLRELAAVVRDNLRRNDVLCRYGGEELAIILPEVDRDGATRACEKARSCIAGHRFEHDGHVIPITASFGVALLEAGVDATRLVAEADARLYAAKSAGRNRVSS